MKVWTRGLKINVGMLLLTGDGIFVMLNMVEASLLESSEPSGNIEHW